MDFFLNKVKITLKLKLKLPIENNNNNNTFINLRFLKKLPTFIK